MNDRRIASGVEVCAIRIAASRVGRMITSAGGGDVIEQSGVFRYWRSKSPEMALSRRAD